MANHPNKNAYRAIDGVLWKKAIYVSVIFIEIAGLAGIILFGLALLQPNMPPQVPGRFPEGWFFLSRYQPVLFAIITLTSAATTGLFEVLRRRIVKFWRDDLGYWGAET
jgi:hypothetical protein